MSSALGCADAKKEQTEDETAPETSVEVSAPDALQVAEDTTLGESADNKFFCEDEVFLIDKKGRFRFGLVIETADSLSEVDDEAPEDNLQKGQLRVAWYPDGKEYVYNDHNIGLVDRTLMPGDVVKRIACGLAPAQHGYCRHIYMRVDVKVLGTQHVIRGVDSGRIRLVNPWERDISVCMDSWVGSIRDVEEKAVLKSAAGSRFEISSSDFHYFKDQKTRHMHGVFNPQIFYPGNQITGSLPSTNNIKLLTPNIPLEKNRRGKFSCTRFTVEDVYTTSIQVVWHCKALSEEQHSQPNPMQSPRAFITGEDLKRLQKLDLVEASLLQIIDRGFLIYEESDEVTRMQQWEEEQTEKYELIFNKQRKCPVEPKEVVPKRECLKATDFPSNVGDTLFTETLLVYSTVCVVWQDGSIEESIPSTELYPVHHVDNHDYFPGDFVSMSKEIANKADLHQYGVVQKVDHEGRCALVKWFTAYSSSYDPQPSYNGETEVSVYDLKDHPDFQFHPGSQVIRVANFVGEDANCTAGQVVDSFPDGKVQVLWVDGRTSNCWPQDLFEIGQEDAEDYDMDTVTDTETWDTESEGSESSNQSIVVESHTLLNISHARESLARLEDLFHISPRLQSTEAMQQLYNFYKMCRQFDEVLKTNYFEDKNFVDLIRRVRKYVNVNYEEEPQSQFQVLPANSIQKGQNNNSNDSSKEYAPKVVYNITNLGLQSSAGTGNDAAEPEKSAEKSHLQSRSCTSIRSFYGGALDRPAAVARCSSVPPVLSQETQKRYDAEKLSLLSCALRNIASALDRACFAKWKAQELELDESVDDTNPLTENEEEPEEYIAIMVAEPEEYEKVDKKEEAQSSHVEPEEYTAPEVLEPVEYENFDKTSLPTENEAQLSNVEPEDYTAPEVVEPEEYETVDETSPPTEKEEAQSSNVEPEECTAPEDVELEEYTAPQVLCERLCGFLKVNTQNYCEDIRQLLYNKLKNKHTMKTDDSAKPQTASDEDQLETGSELVIFESPATAFIAPSIAIAEELSWSSIQEVQDGELASFQMISNAPKNHKFYSNTIEPSNPKQYNRAIQREHHMLQRALPPGAWVKVFEDRMDLMSVMLLGPQHTPYEDGVFLFDMQFGRDYPKSPPACHYISFCTDRLNPNLYEDGKVCVSLLGTWTGRDTEVWGPQSTILQVIVSIQGLILVAEPYFNEAGYEKQKGTNESKKNSLMYNEMAIIKLVQATTKLLEKPVETFHDEIQLHFKRRGQVMYQRFQGWLALSKGERDADKQDDAPVPVPPFPLIPASKGFCITLSSVLGTLKSKLDEVAGIEQHDTEVESSQPAKSLVVTLQPI